jgi:YidC/Oxa1 family membrane protein insertase
MDKNSAIGLSLILLIFVGFSIYNQPSDEQIAAAKLSRDSIAAVQLEEAQAQQTAKVQEAIVDSVVAPGAAALDTTLSDSAAQAAYQAQFGAFGAATQGEDGIIVLENDVIRINVSRKGGRPISVQLKDYKTHDSLPLLLFNGKDNRFSLDFFSQNRRISTQDLYFEPSAESMTVTGDAAKSLNMRLNAGNGRYLEFVYSLKGNDYMIDFDINFVGLEDLVERNATSVDLHWRTDLPSQEKSLQAQRQKSTIYYRFNDEEVDYLSETSDETESLKTGLKWVGFKQQFFSAVLIAEKGLEPPTEIATLTNEADSTIVKTCEAKITLPYAHAPMEQVALKFYFGPNHYKTMKAYDLGLESMIPLGWGIFGWVNKYMVIPVFNLLSVTQWNYGIIILILTLILKLVLMPFTYKSYLSSAKMKVLKPEIDELNAKFEGKDDPMAKQQATMALYSKAGVNPLGGCLPMLFQMPILIAMFNFFPASIELRQESFLWADDLSSFDSIYSWTAHIPLISEYYGNHISLFTILMTISTIIYTHKNMAMSAGNPQMEQLKWMMYLMPFMMLFWFNSYSSGLSYYYFLANMVTFGQQYLFQYLVDDEKLHKQLQENKAKPQKKSGFQKRLEDMAKQRGIEPPKGKKK